VFKIPADKVGFPIRKSPDQSLFAAPRSLSQRITSFFACACQGIHRLPLRHLITLIIDNHASQQNQIMERPACYDISQEHRSGQTRCGLTMRQPFKTHRCCVRQASDNPTFLKAQNPEKHALYNGQTTRGTKKSPRNFFQPTG
jgi:hypothetical protein